MNTKIIATTLAVMLGMGTAAAQTQGVSKNEIVIGSIQDLSGPIAGLGKASRNGMQMRFDEVNEKGGVHGRKIKLVVEDHGYDPKRAVLATRKLLDQDKIFLMLAHIGTAMNEAAMPLLFEKNVINLFPFSPARQMFDPVHRLKFASLTPYYDQARYSVPAIVKEKGLKKPCIIYQDDDYGDEDFDAEFLPASGPRATTKQIEPAESTPPPPHHPAPQQTTAPAPKARRDGFGAGVFGE